MEYPEFKTKRVVVNRCYGAFCLSVKAQLEYAKRAGFHLWVYKEARNCGIPNTNANLYIEVPLDKIPPPGSMEDDFILLTKQPLPKWGDTEFHYNPRFPDTVDIFYDTALSRDDPILVEVVKDLGEEANGFGSKLEIIEIPEDVDYEIYDWDGFESVHEVHRVWP